MTSPQAMTTIVDDLELLVRSRYALIVLETTEEERADALLRHVAAELSIPLLCWSRSRGLRRGTSHLEPAIDGTAEPVPGLTRVGERPHGSGGLRVSFRAVRRGILRLLVEGPRSGQ